MKVEDILRNHKHICWYPSAGADFRELLFLSGQYCRWKNVGIPEDELPDLFVLTDCNPKDMGFGKEEPGRHNIEWVSRGTPISSGTLFWSYDGRTRITATDVKRLEDLEIPLREDLFTLSLSENYGRAFLMRVHVSSGKLGEFDADVLYLLAENTGFALKYLIPGQIPVDYIVRVRYGQGFGGSTLCGDWLVKLIPELKVRYFLSNEVTDDSFQNVPKELAQSYPEMEGIWEKTDVLPLEEIYRVDGKFWSNQGDILWYRCEPSPDTARP